MNIATAIIGVVMLFAYVGTLVWAINAWPFTTIVLFVFALLLFDFVRTLRYGNGDA